MDEAGRSALKKSTQEQIDALETQTRQAENEKTRLIQQLGKLNHPTEARKAAHEAVDILYNKLDGLAEVGRAHALCCNCPMWCAYVVVALVLAGDATLIAAMFLWRTQLPWQVSLFILCAITAIGGLVIGLTGYFGRYTRVALCPWRCIGGCY
jgi:hypothetical protein